MKLSMYIFFVVCLLFSCKTKPSTDANHSIESVLGVTEYLNKKDAADYLYHGEINGYYDYLSISHMLIQTKDEGSYPNRDAALDAYIEKTTCQTLEFTKGDKQFLQSVMDSAIVLIKKVNPKLVLPKVKMIKVTSGHYGENVYYTRGESIVFPENIFVEPKMEEQLPVMLHEIWHILSRYNIGLRESLYKLIGFYPHKYDLVLDPNIRERLLVNPDGVSMDYAIRLAHNAEGPKVQAVPLIRSTQKKFNPSLPNFFDYLSFDMYDIVPEGKLGHIHTHEDGSSKMDKGNFPDFFTQIKDNTQYIIHPDEIMADNFMLAVRANASEDFESFSEEGRQLLNDVLTNLRAFKN